MKVKALLPEMTESIRGSQIIVRGTKKEAASVLRVFTTFVTIKTLFRLKIDLINQKLGCQML